MSVNDSEDMTDMTDVWEQGSSNCDYGFWLRDASAASYF